MQEYVTDAENPRFLYKQERFQADHYHRSDTGFVQGPKHMLKSCNYPIPYKIGPGQFHY